MPLSYRGNNGVLGPTQGPQTGEGEGGEHWGRGGGGSFAIYQDPPRPRIPGSPRSFAALNRIMAFIRGWLIRIRTNAILGRHY